MKANRKFTRSNDDAVSPVIAVILMVAITVVLAATVYVWVSGFGAQTSTPALSIALGSTSAIADGVGTDDSLKTYAVSSASPGMKWGNLKLTLDGTELDYAATFVADTTNFHVSENGAAIDGTLISGSTVKAGQLVKIHLDGDLDGQTLRVLDAQANSVILTLVVG